MEEEAGITFSEIAGYVKKHLFWVLGAALAAAAAVVLVFGLWLNRRTVTYSLTFALTGPVSETGQYADGTPFYSADILSEEALAAACAAQALQSVDTQAMLAADAVTLTSGEAGYTLRVQGRYFKDADQAAAFLHAVANEAAERVRQSAASLDYSVEGEAYAAASLEERLSLLKALRATLLTSYDGWIAAYSGAYRVQAGEAHKTLGNFRAEAGAALGVSAQEALSERIERSGAGRIVPAGDVAAAVASRRAALKEEYARNEAIIRGFGEPTASSAPVERYLARNAAIAVQLGGFLTSETDDGSGALSEAEVRAIAASLDEAYAALGSAAAALKEVTMAIYEDNTEVVTERRTPAAEGDVDLVLAGAAAFIVAFLAACTIVCAVERARRAKVPAAPQPANG